MKKSQVFQEILKNWRVLFPRWVNPDEIMFIDDYCARHPEKKYNWFLRKRLRIKYFWGGFKRDGKQRKSGD